MVSKSVFNREVDELASIKSVNKLQEKMSFLAKKEQLILELENVEQRHLDLAQNLKKNYYTSVEVDKIEEELSGYMRQNYLTNRRFETHVDANEQNMKEMAHDSNIKFATKDLLRAHKKEIDQQVSYKTDHSLFKTLWDKFHRLP